MMLWIVCLLFVVSLFLSFWILCLWTGRASAPFKATNTATNRLRRCSSRLFEQLFELFSVGCRCLRSSSSSFELESSLLQQILVGPPFSGPRCCGPRPCRRTLPWGPQGGKMLIVVISVQCVYVFVYCLYGLLRCSVDLLVLPQGGNMYWTVFPGHPGPWPLEVSTPAWTFAVWGLVAFQRFSIVQWTFSGIFRWMFICVISGV